MNSSNDEQFMGKIGLSVSGIDRGFPFKYNGWERGLSLGTRNQRQVQGVGMIQVVIGTRLQIVLFICQGLLVAGSELV